MFHDKKQSQKLTRVNLDRNIFSIKCGANIYFFPYGGLVQHVIHKFVIRLLKAASLFSHEYIVAATAEFDALLRSTLFLHSRDQT